MYDTCSNYLITSQKSKHVQQAHQLMNLFQSVISILINNIEINADYMILIFVITVQKLLIILANKHKKIEWLFFFFLHKLKDNKCEVFCPPFVQRLSVCKIDIFNFFFQNHWTNFISFNRYK